MRSRRRWLCFHMDPRGRVFKGENCMSTRRVSGPRRKTTRLSAQRTRRAVGAVNKLEDFAHNLKLHRFAGVALGGGKTESTSVAIIEFYPDHKRIFLRGLYEKIKA